MEVLKFSRNQHQIIYLVIIIPTTLESPQSKTVWGSYHVLKFLANSKNVNLESWLGSVRMPCGSPYVDVVLMSSGWLCIMVGRRANPVSKSGTIWLVVANLGWANHRPPHGSSSLTNFFIYGPNDLLVVRPHDLWKHNKIPCHYTTQLVVFMYGQVVIIR